jgi:hypothetical protein
MVSEYHGREGAVADLEENMRTQSDRHMGQCGNVAICMSRSATLTNW